MAATPSDVNDQFELPTKDDSSLGTFDDIFEDDLPEVVVEQPAAPSEGGGTFDDLWDKTDEASKVFSGNRGIVLKALKDYGASDVVTAALMGDIEQESSFNPTLDDHNDPTGAHGLLQVGNQMWDEFDSAAQASGLKRGSKDYVYAQVPFMLDYFKKRNPERWEQMQQMDNAADVVEVFRGDHEGWGYGKAGKRHAYANKFQGMFESIPPDVLLAGNITGAAADFATPSAAYNSTFGDFFQGDEIDTTRPPPLEVDDEDERATGHGDDTVSIPAEVSVPDVEIPDFLKEPEEDKEEAAAPSARPRISVGSGSGEIPAAFQISKRPYDLPDIPQTAAPQDQFVGTPNGPLIPTPAQPDVAESRFTPLQQSFIDMGMGAANLLPTEQVKGVWDSTKQMILPFGTTEDPNVQYPEGGLPARLAESFDPDQYAEQIKAAAEDVKKDPNSREAWKHYTTATATLLPMLPKGSKAYSKANAAIGEVATPLQRLHHIVPQLEKAWNAMSQEERMQLAGTAKDFKDLKPEDQRAVGELFMEREPDYQYSDYEKYSGQRATSTFGGAAARAEVAKIQPGVLLRGKLRAAQRAGEKGYARGSKEAKEAGKAAMRLQKKQLEAQAKKQAADIRETLQTAERWLDADLNTTLGKLKKFSMHLPLKERGKFNDAFARVARMRHPKEIRKHSERILNRMADMLYRVNQQRLSKDIAKGLQKIIDSPSIHVSQKQIAREMLKEFNRMKGYWSLDYLEAMAQRMKEVKKMGRDLFGLSEVVKAEATIATLREMREQGVLKAEIDSGFLTPIEQEQAFWKDFWRQWHRNITKAPAMLKHFNFVTDSIDWMFVRFDGRLSGAMYRNLKLRVDILYSQFLDAMKVYQDKRTAVKEKYRLDARNFRRIAVHAELRQEGGLENLVAKGYTEAELLKYKDINSLTEGEQALLKVDDQINKELYPLLRDVYAKHYNIEIGPSPDGYYARIRDWDAWSTLDIEQKGGFRKTKTEAGFTIERKKDARSNNILDSDLIMNKHIEDVLYTTTLGPEISRIGKVVNHAEFQEMVGNFGQRLFADYVDTLARNGGVEGGRRFHVVDTLKKNLGVGYLGFRLTTIALQPTALLMSMPYAAFQSIARGVTSIMDKGNREWILKTFPEVRESVRGGKIDDPAYAVYTDKDAIAKGIMAPIRWMDGLARMSAVEAFYRDALAKRGLPFDRDAVPHPEAVAEAQRMVRMTQAGPLPKDAAQALTRGAVSEVFLGRPNVSIDQAILQFQSFIMNRWSNFKYAAGRIGIKESNPAVRAKLFGYAILATYVEQLGREGIANLKRATLGMGEQEASRVKQEQEEGLPVTISKKVAVDLLSSIPGVSNVTGKMRYGSEGAPLLDTLSQLAEGTVTALRGKETEGAIAFSQALGGLFGAPTGEIGDALMRIAREQKRQKKIGPYRDEYQFDFGPGMGAGGMDAGPGM